MSMIAQLEAAFSQCLAKKDIDAPIGGGYFENMIEVLNDACSDTDQTIQRALMQALIDCAAKGQIEAINSLHLVKDHFVKNVMNFEKNLAK